MNPFVMNKISFLLILSLLATASIAQTVLSGYVTDKDSKAPISYASITTSWGTGTATGEDGRFVLADVPVGTSQRIKLSCIGYASRSFSSDSLLLLKVREVTIMLQPVALTLAEIVVHGEQLDAKELVRQAIEAIPANYEQLPFNMEYFSSLAVKDTTGQGKYLQETIVRSYRAGYREGAVNQSMILEKRTTGLNVLPAFDQKRNIEYFIYESSPGFDVFLADLIGTGRKSKFSVFSSDYFKRLEFRRSGSAVFEKDTITIVDYDLKNFRSEEERGFSGRLYISTRNLAIIKHERKIGKINLEVTYRAYGGKYFPYFIKSIRPEKKVGSSYTLIVVHEAYIQKVETENVVSVSNAQMMNGWHLDDVPYRKEFWNSFRPKR